MKLFFENKSGSSFEIEVDYKDTLLEVKQKIEKSHRIPVSNQTLFFNGMVLQDHLDLEQCQIVQESRLQLFVSNQTEESPSPSNAREQIIDGHDQDSTVTSSNSVEETITNIQDSSVKERTRKKRMVVYVTPYPGRESKATREIPVAVNVKKTDQVKELRNELVKIEERGELNLPREGYFLIHRNRVLIENLSFWVAGVNHDDTIEILPKHLTRGSFGLDS